MNPTQLGCEYCGRVLRTPVSVEEEIALVRAQAHAANAIATEKGNAVLSVLTMGGADQIKNNTRLSQFWATAYIPATPPALVAAIHLCAVGVPNTNMQTAEQHLPLINALATRAEVLSRVVLSHPDASVADKAAARDATNFILGRQNQAQNHSRRQWVVLFGMMGGIFGFLLLVLAGFGISRFLSTVGKTPAQLAEDACRGQHGGTQMTGCLEACSLGVSWTCEKAELLKKEMK